MTIPQAPGAPRRPLLARIAIWSYSHRRQAIAAWLFALIALTGLGRAAGSRFLDDFSGGNSQSQQAQNLLTRKFPADAGDRAQVVFHAAGRLDSPPTADAVEALLGHTRTIPHVTGVTDPLSTAGASQLSADGRTGYAVVQFDETSDRLPSSSANKLLALIEGSHVKGLQVVAGGAPIAKVPKPKFGKSEGVGLLAALVILLVAFGSLVAASLPIATALFGLAISFGVLDLVSHGQTVPTFAPELAALLGIGVGIDYALFIVTRYRERLAEGDSALDAVAMALSTSGKAVLFAGVTVVVSLLGLFVVGLPYITGAAIGAIAAVLLVMSAALTLLPALLGAQGPRIDRLSVHRKGRPVRTEGTWAWRWSQSIQRRPAVAGVAALVVLVVLSIPLFAIRVGYGDAGNDPKSTETRMSYDILARDFGAGAVGPLVLAASVPQGGQASAALSDLRARIAQDPDVVAVSAPRLNPAGDTAVVNVVPQSAPQDASTVRLVHAVRHLDPDHAFHDPVRTVDGLRAVPHVTRTRTMAAPPGQPGGGDRWARRNGPGDHRSRGDNGVRFWVLRTQRRAATAHLRAR